MPPHPLTNFEIQEYYKNEPRFNGVYSGDNLPKTIKNVINLQDSFGSGTHWVRLHVKDNKNNDDSFGVEYLSKEVTKFIGNKYIKSNIFRVEIYDSVMCGYFCIGFIEFILAGKSLIYFTSLFSPEK